MRECACESWTTLRRYTNFKTAAFPITAQPQNMPPGLQSLGSATLHREKMPVLSWSSVIFICQMPPEADEITGLFPITTNRGNKAPKCSSTLGRWWHMMAPLGTSLLSQRRTPTPPSKKTSTYLICGTPDLFVNLSHRKVQTNDLIVH